MIIQRIHNNNVVQAGIAGSPAMMLVGKGIGFGVKVGDQVDESKIEHRYTLLDESASKSFETLLATYEPDIIATTHLIVELAITGLQIERPDRLIPPIADHLTFAIKRYSENIVVDMPLMAEVSQYYPQEYELGKQALTLVRLRHAIQLPPQEAAAFALHFVSAQLASTQVSQALQMTRVITQTFAIINEYTPVPIVEDSNEAARFVTHLRFAFVRFLSQEPRAEIPISMFDTERPEMQRPMLIANRIAEQISGEYNFAFTQNEVFFIALHLYRLLASLD